MSDFKDVKDSGQRRESSTGSVRDRAEGKGRYDLITPIGLRRLAIHYENGARKYGDRNWERGQPVSWYIDSAIRHLFRYLEGKRDEDHLAAVAWNALGAIHTVEKVCLHELPDELDDVPAACGEGGVPAALAAISDAIEAAEEVEAVEVNLGSIEATEVTGSDRQTVTSVKSVPPSPSPRFPIPGHVGECRFPELPCTCLFEQLPPEPECASPSDNCLACESDDCLPGTPDLDDREPPENVLDHLEISLVGHDYPCEYPRHACVCEDDDLDCCTSQEIADDESDA